MKNKIAIYRKEFNLTQEDLAKLVATTRQTIISLESGRYKPSIILAYKIAKIFNVSIEDLFDLESEL